MILYHIILTSFVLVAHTTSQPSTTTSQPSTTTLEPSTAETESYNKTTTATTNVTTIPTNATTPNSNATTSNNTSTTPKPDTNEIDEKELSTNASLYVVVIYLPCLLIIAILCRFVPDWVNKLLSGR